MAVLSGKAYVGVDIGGTNLRFALVDELGAILRREHQSTEIGLGREHFIDKLLTGIRSMVDGGNALHVEIDAIGLGIPGLIAGVRHGPVIGEPAVDRDGEPQG